MKILFISKDFSGSGLCLRLHREGHEVRAFVEDPLYGQVLDGLVEKVASLDDGFAWVGRDGLLVFTNQSRVESKGIELLAEGKRETGYSGRLSYSYQDTKNLGSSLPEAHRRGILTISDMRNFARLGGMINLLTIDDRVTFDLNLSVASKASISFSSHLLKLAHDIIN